MYCPAHTLETLTEEQFRRMPLLAPAWLERRVLPKPLDERLPVYSTGGDREGSWRRKTRQ